MELDRDQQRAVDMAMENKVLIMTGGPGTGKTTTLKTMLAEFNLNRFDVALAAPTGKAAKRMSESCKGYEAKTIHRLLEYSPKAQAFMRDKSNPLDAQLVVVDESSMLDTHLAAALFSAINPSAKLVLVGDKDQLPSVGPGNVLKDLIASGVIPVAELKTIHRQSEHSWIPVNAQQVNQGKPFIIDEHSVDFFVEYIENADQVQKRIIQLITEEIPQKHGFDPFRDVQLLCPQKTSAVGVKALNMALQEKMNPENGGPKAGFFRERDKVIHVRNNYKLDVMNGETGVIIAIENKQILVDYGDKEVWYDNEAMADLQHAYAMTIHKSQGSEWGCVVLPIHSTNYHMLSRNLLYTGITRAGAIVYIVGNQKGIRQAIRNNDVQKRYTGLGPRLKEYFNQTHMFSKAG